MDGVKACGCSTESRRRRRGGEAACTGQRISRPAVVAAVSPGVFYRDRRGGGRCGPLVHACRGHSSAGDSGFTALTPSVIQPDESAMSSATRTRSRNGHAGRRGRRLPLASFYRNRGGGGGAGHGGAPLGHLSPGTDHRLGRTCFSGIAGMVEGGKASVQQSKKGS